MSSSNCASAGLMACGFILMEATVPSHLADDLDGAAAAGGLDSAGGEFGLDLCHLLLHAGSLFDEFSDVGHSSDIGGLGADINDLAFENFQGLLNQGIVFEIVLVEGGGSVLV